LKEGALCACAVASKRLPMWLLASAHIQISHPDHVLFLSLATKPFLLPYHVVPFTNGILYIWKQR
jgi:hypothetical protein